MSNLEIQLGSRSVDRIKSGRSTLPKSAEPFLECALEGLLSLPIRVLHSMWSWNDAPVDECATVQRGVSQGEVMYVVRPGAVQPQRFEIRCFRRLFNRCANREFVVREVLPKQD